MNAIIDRIKGIMMHGHKSTDIIGLDEVPPYISEDTSTKILSGSIEWVSGLTFKTMNLKYQILGVPYTVPDQEISLDNSDESDPRIDVIAGNVFGELVKITGTPAPSPSKPLVDPATQIELTFATLLAGATTPSNITTETVYDENTEYDTSKVEDTDVSIDFDDATDPANGSKCFSIAMNAAGNTGIWSRGDLAVTNNVTIKKNITLASPLNGSYNVDFTDGYASDHMTDQTSGNSRNAIYYRLQNKFALTGYFTSLSTGTIYYVMCSGFTKEAFAIAELGFSVQVPNVITLVDGLLGSNLVLPAGNYELTLTGFDRYVQNFTTTNVVTFTPSLSAAIFTKPLSGTIDINGGILKFQLKTTKALLANSGLLIELYNGATQVGYKALLSVNYYGFNPNVINAWQNVTVPVLDFNLSSTIITEIRLRPINEYPNDIILYGDLVIIQTGSQRTTGGAIQLTGDVTGEGNNVIPTVIADNAINPAKVSITADTTPQDTDEVISIRSAAFLKTTWTNIKAFLKTYFDTLYQGVEDIAFDFNDIEAGSIQTYILDIKASFAYTILKAVLQSDDTMDNIAIKINGTSVTGLEAVDVTDVAAETNATALNSVVAGDQVTLVTSGTDGDPTLLRGKLVIQRV